VTRRDPRCVAPVWGHEQLATMLNNRGDYAAARRELAEAEKIAATCQQAVPTLPGAFARAQVALDDQVAGVRAEVAQLRAAHSTVPTVQVALDLVEGIALLDPASTDAGPALAGSGAGSAAPSGTSPRDP